MVSLTARQRESSRYGVARFKELVGRIYGLIYFDGNSGDFEVTNQMEFSMAMSEWREQIQHRLTTNDQGRLALWLLETEFDLIFPLPLIWELSDRS